MTATKRFLSIIMAIVLLTSTIIIPVSAATLPRNSTTNTKTGYLGDQYGKDPLIVYTNGKAAKLRICTFNQNGDRTGGKITVLAVADSGAEYKWSVKGCNGIFETTSNITLPKGNTRYKIYIKRDGRSNANRTKTFYFSIDYMKNCSRPY